MSAVRESIRPTKRLRPRGFRFPFSKTAAGFPAAEGPPDIFSSNIKQILLTTPGERVMRPTFGCNLKSFLHAQQGPFLIQAVEDAVRTSIEVWEPRVSGLSVDTHIDGTKVVVSVAYSTPVGVGQTSLTFRM